MKHIVEIAKKAGIKEEYVIQYGNDKAKISSEILKEVKDNKTGKLVLVTAITPTKVGEGKTTSSICLHDGMHKIGVNSLLCLREPSLGPVLGIKGGATGGGLATVIPTEDINLHFTGDMHALTSSINLISAIIDNHVFQGNEIGIDPSRIIWKRALDMNDRALRSVTVMQDEKKGQPRHDEFVITVASELMAILCISKDAEDFKNRVNNIVVAYTFDNIAHGCNSLIATSLALKLAPVVITEAGFGGDLGAEKFLDIKCRVGGLHPDAIVMVATIRALKMHGGQAFEDLDQENIEALLKGACNLEKHMENMSKYDVPAVICINHFTQDTKAETEALIKWIESKGYDYAFCDGYSRGGEGSVDLAKKVQYVLENKESHYHPLYDVNQPIPEKIAVICKEIYGASDVVYGEKALEQIKEYERLGFDKTPICIAKTPLSLTDNPKVLGRPENFVITIREIRLSAGAGFLVPLTGAVMTMPGLPKVPAAVKMENE